MASNIPDKFPMLQPTLPFLTRLFYNIKIHLLQSFVRTALGVMRLRGDKSILPTFTKAYPCHPKLVHRFFIPKTHQAGDAPLPLYLDIHGGGFVICDAQLDDKFCSAFATDNKVVVVSIEYRLAPGAQFPTSAHEIADVISAVLGDDALPIDKTKVALGGFSAGGNLAFAVAQMESLKGTFGGVVGFYPVVDFTRRLKDQLAERPKDAPTAEPVHSVGLFDFAYIPPGQDLKDPLLSVAFAPQENLPQKVCLVGCEFDSLTKSSEIMAKDLAGTGEKKGSDVAWEKNGVRWEKILGQPHGFDLKRSSGAQKVLNDKAAKQMYDNVAKWLFQEVYV